VHYFSNLLETGVLRGRTPGTFTPEIGREADCSRSTRADVKK